MDDQFTLGFEEPGVLFESASQNARVWTETWVNTWLFCPNCGAQKLRKYESNRPVADFFCEGCPEVFELKSQKKPFGRRVTDGAYRTMCERLAARDNPSLILMTYDAERRGVTDLLFVPKHFFVQDLIEPRRPLAATARRAGWVGCNIRLDKIPEAGRIPFVRNRIPAPKSEVLARWRETLFLRDRSLVARGWLMDVMRCVDEIGRADFALEDVYGFETRLQAIYPGNRNVRPKIRQQLQVLRDNGYLEFLGRGRYRLRSRT